MGAVDGRENVGTGLCNSCGRSDLKVVKTLRKRVYDLGKDRRQVVSIMYVIKVGMCTMCGTSSIQHSGAMPGTSFGPVLRAHVSTCRRGHATEQDIHVFLANIEKALFSVGIISAYVSAITEHLKGTIMVVPDEEPIILDESDLREYHSPVRPPGLHLDSEYDRVDAAITQRSTL